MLPTFRGSGKHKLPKPLSKGFNVGIMCGPCRVERLIKVSELWNVLPCLVLFAFGATFFPSFSLSRSLSRSLSLSISLSLSACLFLNCRVWGLRGSGCL